MPLTLFKCKFCRIYRYNNFSLHIDVEGERCFGVCEVKLNSFKFT